MKKKFLVSLVTVFAMALSAGAQTGDGERNMKVQVFQLTEEGQLAAMLAEAGDDADSVVVGGRMNDADVQALRAYCRDGHVLGVDISKVVLKNDSLPMSAFGWTGMENPVENITLPEGLRVIGPYAFYFMGHLKHVEIPPTLEKICYSAFTCCQSMRGISLPDGLTTIESQAFESTGLEELTLPASVKKVRYGLVTNCPELTTLTILGDIGSVPNDMCYLCPKLETVTLPASIRRIGSGAFGCTALEKFPWPDALEVIGSEAFSEVRMEEVILPSHVSEIGERAFDGNELLQRITLPASLQSISQDAFDGSTALAAVYSESPVPPSTNHSHWAPSAVLYVPEGAVDAYKAAPWWQDFKEIRTFVPAAIGTIPSPDLGDGSPASYRPDGIRASGSTQRGIYIAKGRKFMRR